MNAGPSECTDALSPLLAQRWCRTNDGDSKRDREICKAAAETHQELSYSNRLFNLGHFAASSIAN
jgi:hypothetical protein